MFELKESDLPELEKLAADGATWIARDQNGRIMAYSEKPKKHTSPSIWVCSGTVKFSRILEENALPQLSWSDPEPLNIAAAIAQIKAQGKPTIKSQSAEEILNEFCAEQDKKPLTWNERINLMTVEEKADWLIGFCSVAYRKNVCGTRCCKDCITEYLTSPCEGGEKGVSIYDECERMTTTNRSGKAILKHPIVCGECKNIENAPYDENGYNVANWISVLEDLLFDKDGNAIVKYSRLAELAAAEREGCEYVQQDEDSDEWDCSKCGNAFVLISENPYVNDMFYCPKCGRPIKSINTLTFDWSNDEGECRIEKIITREEYAAALAGKGE